MFHLRFVKILLTNMCMTKYGVCFCKIYLFFLVRMVYLHFSICYYGNIDFHLFLKILFWEFRF